MAFHLLWGLVLWFSISKLGMGLSTDSVHLLFAATNLSHGNGLISFDGSPVVAWPPLYPVLLAGIAAVSGLSAFAAAHVLQAAAFLGLSLCVSILFLKIFPDDFPLALAGNILSDMGVAVVAGFGMVGSDYVFLFLAVLAVLLTLYYVEHGSRGFYAALFAACMLATLQRYLGIALILSAAASVLLLATGKLRQRLLRGGMLLLAALPAGVWYMSTSALVERRNPVSLRENLEWFWRGLLEWFVRAGSIKEHPLLYGVLFALVLAALFGGLLLARRTVAVRSAAPMLLFGLSYVLGLFGTAAVAYYNKLAGRFLLPLYIPFVALVLLALRAGIDRLQIRLPARIVGCGLIALLGILLLRISAPVITESHANGSVSGENAFNTPAWRGNDALAFWRANKPQGYYLLFSNMPDAAAFYTGHACQTSPRRFSGPYGKQEFPVESYASELFGSGRAVYLLWIEPEDRDYYYTHEDLETIARVEQLYEGEGGAIYRLFPRGGG